MALTGVRDIVEDLRISDAEADALIAKFIKQDPHRPGRHEAWVDAGGGGAQVWIIIPYLRVSGVPEIMRAYNLPAEAVHAAIAYYRRHRSLFDARILLNDEEWAAW